MEKTTSKASDRLLDFYLLKRLFYYVKSHPFLFLSAFVFMLLTNFFSTAYPYLIKLGVDDYVMVKDTSGLNKIILLLLIFLICVFVFRVIHIVLINILGQKLLFSLRKDILKKVFSLTLKILRQYPHRKSIDQSHK